ncbi:MAG: acetyl-CoA carboxylase carboxyltransferase subunit alpha [Alphaproteobacteria bacterium]|nr:acetyl-CoA carboxylase carboxyltransferase subunit alpha [Alphaproteobacteria bacterium]
MHHYLDFEKSIAELEGKIEELRHLTGDGEVNIADEVSKLQDKLEKQLNQLYAKLSPWQKAQVARHPERPHAVDYIKALIEDFTPLAGDRLFAEDAAVVGGLGRFRGQSVMVLGIEKGKDTETRVKHNFGMAMPEGYRKAQRLMLMADRFRLPVITFVDTSGAYPGADAEERGQAEAIAKAIEVSFKLRVPFISVVIGEGGSGGAIALASANTVLMLEHSIYSVISPEGCASILWRDGSMNKEAAEALRLTAQDLLELKVVDAVVPEPMGGAHRNPRAAMMAVADEISRQLEALKRMDGGQLKTKRREKFLEMGQVGLG